MSEKLIETQKISELPVVDKLEDGDYFLTMTKGILNMSSLNSLDKLSKFPVNTKSYIGDIDLLSNGVYPISSSALNKPAEGGGFLVRFTSPSDELSLYIGDGAKLYYRVKRYSDNSGWIKL